MAGIVPVVAGILEGIQKARDWVDAPAESLSPLERAGKAGVGAYCRAVPALPIGGYSFGITIGLATQYICDPIWNEPGNQPDGGFPQPPFEGGQCQGQRYNASLTVQVSAVDCTAGGGISTVGPFNLGPYVGNGYGPISLVKPALVAMGTGAKLTAQVKGFDINGNAIVITDIAEQICPQARPEALNGSVTHQFTVVPFDGGPDVCGDPPPEYEPPVIGEPYNWGDPVPTGPGLPPVSVPDPTGRPVPGIDINFPDGTGISLNFGDGPVGGGEPAPPDRPEDGGVAEGGAASAGQGGEYDFGEPPEGSEWVGYRWSFDYDPIIYGGVVGTGPEWVSPRVLGNAALRLETTVGQQGAFLADSERVDRAAGAQFRPVGGLRVVGCKFVVLPTLQPVIIPLAAPLPPPDVTES